MFLSTVKDLLHRKALLPQALPSAFLQGKELFTQHSYQEADGSIRIFFISLSQQIQPEPFGLQQAQFSLELIPAGTHAQSQTPNLHPGGLVSVLTELQQQFQQPQHIPSDGTSSLQTQTHNKQATPAHSQLCPRKLLIGCNWKRVDLD